MTPTVPTWQSKLQGAIRRDPAKAGVMGVLAVVLLILLGRGLAGGKGGAVVAQGAPSDTNRPKVAPAPASFRIPSRRSDNSAAAMRQWLSASPAGVSRNLFIVPMDYYTRASTKPGLKSALKSENPSPDDKSAQIAADEEKERQTLIGNLKLDAMQLKLQSTLMSDHPTALINGQMVKVGDQIAPPDGQASFTIDKIEPRQVIIERENVKLELLMQ